MKNCRKVSGLMTAILNGENAVLKVWDIMDRTENRHGAYLNLGEGKYSSVGEDNWLLIRDHIVDQDGEYCKNIPKYTIFYQDQKFTCAYCGKEISTNKLQRYPSEDARIKEYYCSDCFMRNSVEI